MKLLTLCFHRLLLPATLFALTSCGHALPSLPGFDAAAWKADPYGCRGQRATLLPILEKHRTEIFEARINDITKLLGHPDEEELGEQSDKVYIYYVAPGTQCAPSHPRAAPNRVMLRSGATGTVTEVILPVQNK
ncbi:hypothetical protein [Hymenobacter psychrophilus]|uniref:Lipoprotein n=1 Tax=Hymenobacter psychrophilus TaxID=651662 RepID=A0A1H3CQ59_9BACT|nr:hypothetical protein [Hymenobacter psychrophilus]SDX55559.1 hypothetical protein SAMN04488069_10253 [Hymenobacter psychrophilus]